MIEKIISGGQTGAGKAALDAAVRLGIPHGGRGSDLPARGSGEAPAENTGRNMQEAGGTLMMSHGAFEEQAAFVRKMAQHLGKPWLHIDLHQNAAFHAATLINDWIVDNDIRILHVTGPGAGQDPGIYKATLDILQAVFFLNLTEANMSHPSRAAFVGEERDTSPPRSVEEAVERILNDMQLKERTTLANLREEELASLQLTLGAYIRRQLDSWPFSQVFQASCTAAAREEGLHESSVTMILIRKLWKKLRETHRLRVVK